MKFKDNKGRMDDVVAYTIPGNTPESVYVLEIGKGAYAQSRISLVDKNTGIDYASGFANCGATSESWMDRIEDNLIMTLYAGERIKEIYSEITSRAGPRVIHQGGFRFAG